MAKKESLQVTYSPEERDEAVYNYNRLLEINKRPGEIVVEHKNVRGEHQWEIYYKT